MFKPQEEDADESHKESVCVCDVVNAQLDTKIFKVLAVWQFGTEFP